MYSKESILFYFRTYKVPTHSTQVFIWRIVALSMLAYPLSD